MEAPLITKETVREFWAISQNMNDSRVNPFILRAQQRDLKPFLGDALYRDFVTKLSADNYTLLLNGCEYTYGGNLIIFNGVKALLSAYAYAQLLLENPISVSRAGNKNKTDENSTEIDQFTTNLHSNLAKNEAIRLQAETEQYLNTQKSEYPLWRVGSSVNGATETAVRFNRIPRSTQI